MTNREYILSKHTKEELLDAINNLEPAIYLSNKTFEFHKCSDMCCEECALNNQRERSPQLCLALKDWLEKEHEEPPVDWSEVPAGTLIEVSLFNDAWLKRNFACYLNGEVCCFAEGYDSSKDAFVVIPWKHARLIKDVE